jgi:hypothetical protein
MEIRIVSGLAPAEGLSTIQGSEAVAVHVAEGSTSFVMRVGSGAVIRIEPPARRAAPNPTTLVVPPPLSTITGGPDCVMASTLLMTVTYAVRSLGKGLGAIATVTLAGADPEPPAVMVTPLPAVAFAV